MGVKGVTTARRELVESEIRALVQNEYGQEPIAIKAHGSGRCGHSLRHGKVIAYDCAIGKEPTYQITYCPTCRVARWQGASGL